MIGNAGRLGKFETKIEISNFSAVARSWSAYFDNMLDNYIKNTTIGALGELSEPGGFFSTYPDILSFLLICLCACVIAVGPKVSANVNSSFVVLNIVVSRSFKLRPRA